MVFCFVQKFFFGQHKSYNKKELWRKARIFFPELNIRLYDKNSESDYFFSLHQNQNIFFSKIGNQNTFLEKNHTPSLQVKWSFPNTTMIKQHATYFISGLWKVQQRNMKWKDKMLELFLLSYVHLRIFWSVLRSLMRLNLSTSWRTDLICLDKNKR